MIFQPEEDASVSLLRLIDGYSNFRGYLDQISFQLTPNHTKPWAPGPYVPIHLFSRQTLHTRTRLKEEDLNTSKIKSIWMIHANKRGARVEFLLGRPTVEMKQQLDCDCIRLSQHGNSVQNRTNCRQATSPTQRNDSEVITNKQKQWTVQDRQLFWSEKLTWLPLQSKIPTLKLE